MSHKVNPIGFRLKGTDDWASRWFSARSPRQYLEEDYKVREFLVERFKDASVEKVEIERSPNKIDILIYSSRPGLIIGRGGEQIEQLRDIIQKKILKRGKEKQALKIEVKSVKNPWLSANLTAQWVGQRLEKRLPFRKVLKQSISMASGYKEVKGIRIQISGRLNGVAIARREWLQQGKMPRQTIRADIDYGFYKAVTTYGTVGVKVWIYKGEKFE
jgi:small subunit ribosomal protein S3